MNKYRLNVFFIMLFLFGLLVFSSDIVALPNCYGFNTISDNSGNPVYIAYGSLEKNFMIEERRCNLHTTKGNCLNPSHCGSCEWQDDPYPGDYSASYPFSSDGYRCHASSKIGFSCGMMITPAECLANRVGTDGCNWNAGLNICTGVSGDGVGGIDRDLSSCHLGLLQSGVMPDGSESYLCVDDSDYVTTRASHFTHLGHDVFCQDTSDRINWWSDSPTGTWSIYFDQASSWYFASCTKSPYPTSIPPRTQTNTPSSNNCTCIPDMSGSPIYSPLICLSSDYRVNYNCPPGYHLPTATYWSGPYRHSINASYKTIGSNVCESLPTYGEGLLCNALSPYCQEVEYGLCTSVSSNAGNISTCASYTDYSPCHSDPRCRWVNLYNVCKTATPLTTSTTCGNGVNNSLETCDGAWLNGNNCTTVMGAPGWTGTLSCNSTCTGFITTSCIPPAALCPNNVINSPPEVCDNNTISCTILYSGYTGNAPCNPTCSGYINTSCVAPISGCTANSNCSTRQYCNLTTHACTNMPICAKWNAPNGNTFVPQTNLEDNNNDCNPTGYTACSNAYTRVAGNGNCSGTSYSCNSGGSSAVVALGKVCKNGLSIDPYGDSQCGLNGEDDCYCNMTINCMNQTCSATRFYLGYNSSLCTETNRQYAGIWNVPTSNYVINSTRYISGSSCTIMPVNRTMYCSNTGFNACFGSAPQGTYYGCSANSGLCDIAHTYTNASCGVGFNCTNGLCTNNSMCLSDANCPADFIGLPTTICWNTDMRYSVRYFYNYSCHPLNHTCNVKTTPMPTFIDNCSTSDYYGLWGSDACFNTSIVFNKRSFYDYSCSFGTCRYSVSTQINITDTCTASEICKEGTCIVAANCTFDMDCLPDEVIRSDEYCLNSNTVVQDVTSNDYSCKVGNCVVNSSTAIIPVETCAIGFKCEVNKCVVNLTTEEICDNIDNDGDSLIDENLFNSTGCNQVGACSGSFKKCDLGVWSNCSILPITEICNSIDDDCDNLVDEDNVCVVINTNCSGFITYRNRINFTESPATYYVNATRNSPIPYVCTSNNSGAVQSNPIMINNPRDWNSTPVMPPSYQFDEPTMTINGQTLPVCVEVDEIISFEDLAVSNVLHARYASGARLQFCNEMGYETVYNYRSRHSGDCYAFNGQWIIAHGYIGSISCSYNFYAGHGENYNLAFGLQGRVYKYICSNNTYDGVCPTNFDTNACTSYSGSVTTDLDCGNHTFIRCLDVRDMQGNTVGNTCRSMTNISTNRVNVINCSVQSVLNSNKSLMHTVCPNGAVVINSTTNCPTCLRYTSGTSNYMSYSQGTLKCVNPYDVKTTDTIMTDNASINQCAGLVPVKEVIALRTRPIIFGVYPACPVEKYTALNVNGSIVCVSSPARCDEGFRNATYNNLTFKCDFPVRRNVTTQLLEINPDCVYMDGDNYTRYCGLASWINNYEMYDNQFKIVVK